MADENNTNPPTDAVAAVAPIIPAIRKQRGPRRQKTVTEAVAAPSAVTKSTRAYRKKVSEEAADAKPTSVETPATGKRAKKDSDKRVGGTKSLASPKQTSTVRSTAIDEMSDLLQLEEENKRLRKALSDKLRAENADLRKRLGVM